MTAAAYRSTSVRVLRQLRADPRTVAMILVVPLVLLALLYFLFRDQPTLPGGATRFDRIGVIMLGVLPFALMFLITSVAMLRERTSGTLERLLTTPIRKIDLLAGYGTAFTVAAAAQAVAASAVCYVFLGLDTAGNPGWVLLIALADATLGVALGLLCSAFARTEFQAVQFLPIVVIPQLFVCGLFVPRSEMPGWLQGFSSAMPLTYAVDALTEVARSTSPTTVMWRDLGVVVACTLVAVVLAAATLRRRSR